MTIEESNRIKVLEDFITSTNSDLQEFKLEVNERLARFEKFMQDGIQAWETVYKMLKSARLQGEDDARNG